MTGGDPMDAATKRERELARRLIVQEAGGDQSALGLVLGTDRAFDRLYRHMSDMIGTEGFNVLARRALHLATLRYAFLGSVTVEIRPDKFRLQGLEASIAGREPAEVDAGLVAILGSFFWLLVTFVGDNLFNRLLAGAWPTISRKDDELGTEGQEA